MVNNDPSVEEMKKVVVTENKRPSLPNRWIGDPVRLSDRHTDKQSDKTTDKQTEKDRKTGSCKS